MDEQARELVAESIAALSRRIEEDDAPREWAAAWYAYREIRDAFPNWLVWRAEASCPGWKPGKSGSWFQNWHHAIYTGAPAIAALARYCALADAIDEHTSHFGLVPPCPGDEQLMRSFAVLTVDAGELMLFADAPDESPDIEIVELGIAVVHGELEFVAPDLAATIGVPRRAMRHVET